DGVVFHAWRDESTCVFPRDSSSVLPNAERECRSRLLFLESADDRFDSGGEHLRHPLGAVNLHVRLRLQRHASWSDSVFSLGPRPGRKTAAVGFTTEPWVSAVYCPEDGDHTAADRRLQLCFDYRSAS